MISAINLIWIIPLAAALGLLLGAMAAAANWKKYPNQFRALEDYTVDGTINGELDRDKI
jgi:hypothetical protein